MCRPSAGGRAPWLLSTAPPPPGGAVQAHLPCQNAGAAPRPVLRVGDKSERTPGLGKLTWEREGIEPAQVS